MESQNILALCQCPHCGGVLGSHDALVCTQCGQRARLAEGKISFFPVPPGISGKAQGAQYQTWSAWRKANYHFFERELSSLNDQSLVIDLGAGPVQFRELFHRFQRYVAVDFYPYERIAIVTDLTKPLPFKQGIADVVVLSNTIEHIPDTQALLKECARVLKPGGRVLITVPFLMRVHQAPYDFNRYTSYQLERLLLEAGFENILVQPLGTLFDVYEKLQRQFFSYLLGGVYSTSGLINRGYRLLAKALWFSRRASVILWVRFLKKLPATDAYTEGFGCVGVKKS